MKLRRADCGHWILADTPPTGTEDRGSSEYPVWLCAECKRGLTEFERKDVIMTAAGAEEFERRGVTTKVGRSADGKFQPISRED